MSIGYLVYPDLTSRTLTFEIEEAARFLGDLENDRVYVAFQDDGETLAALYSAGAKANGAEPNPVASMARNQAATGNSRFLTDPVSAICGPVIFIGADGADVTEKDIAKVERGIQAVRNYREDEPDEYALWRGAVLNIARRDVEAGNG
ncbi:MULTISPECIES: hypothetical protein [unclassified Corynebacterium]|uniref:hypothetical protein n=1 Tax=unclassified Corynebacterium TaxID=2624378 RepID=UPI003523E8B0